MPFFLAVVVFLLGNTSLAKSYAYKDITQTIQITQSGQLEVQDTRHYEFRGEFSQASLNIDPTQPDGLGNVSVTDLDLGVVQFSQTDNQIAWTFAAKDTTRRFAVAYTLQGELEVAEDAVRLNRLTLEPKHAPVANYTLRLMLPSDAPALFKVFVFTKKARLGSLDFFSGSATVRLQNLEQDEWVRVVVLFDRQQVPQAAAEPYIGLDPWLADLRRETKDFRNASARATQNGGFAARAVFAPNVWWFVLPFVSAAVLLLLILLTPKNQAAENASQREAYFRKKYAVQYFQEPPERIPAGVVPFVMSRYAPGAKAVPRAVAATLMEFTANGWLRFARPSAKAVIQKRAETDFEFAKPPDRRLNRFEHEVWLMLEANSFDRKTIRSRDIRKHFAEDPDWRQDMAELPRPWYEQTYGKLHDTIKATSNIGCSGLMISLLLLAAGIIALFFEAWRTWGWAALGAALIHFVLVGVAPTSTDLHWKPEKLQLALRWEAYARFLCDFSQMKKAPSEHLRLWDYHFVYAAALGVTKKYLHNLRLLAQQHPNDFLVPDYFSTIYLATDGFESLFDFGDSLAANLSSLETALSGDSSFGGGFGGDSLGDAGGSDGSSDAS